MTEEIRRWVQEKADSHCDSCPDTCCDGTKHIISIDSNDCDALALFTENSIPLYREKELDTDSVEDWLKGGYAGPVSVRTKTKKKIRKPALIEHNAFDLDKDEVFWKTNHKYSLYVEQYCPLYDRNTGCLVHNDPRRPRVCQEYPVFIKDDKAAIANSCHFISIEGMIREFSEKFAGIAIIVR